MSKDDPKRELGRGRYRFGNDEKKSRRRAYPKVHIKKPHEKQRLNSELENASDVAPRNILNALNNTADYELEKALEALNNPADNELEIVKEEVREKVLKALNNPKYRARTLSGISKETHIAPKQITNAIKKEPLSSLVKIIPKRADNGSFLITTKDRFESDATLKEKFIDFFASKRGSF